MRVSSASLFCLGAPRYRTVGTRVFWRLFWGVTAARVAIFLCHVASRNHVFRFLRGTQSWRKVVGDGDHTRALGVAISDGSSFCGAGAEAVHLLHALATGLLCHALAVGSLYTVLVRFDHSLALLPARLVVDLACLARFHKCDFNAWLYRDHWVCHHQVFLLSLLLLLIILDKISSKS
jgi:hypothetical protein